MKNRVLFETSYMNLIGFLIIIYTICKVLLLYFIGIKGLKKLDERIRIKGRRLGIFWHLEIVILFFMIIFIVIEGEEYINIVVQYKLGHYDEIEGFVENYSFEPDKDWNGTVFTVDGVEFHYPNSVWGYDPMDQDSSVIKENGQHLRIRYITDEVIGNVIVYIEQLRQEEEIH